MGNPINITIPITRGGFRKTASVRPPGRTQRGVNENVSPESKGTTEIERKFVSKYLILL